MKDKTINIERLRQLFDYKEGKLIWRYTRGNAKKGDPAGEQHLGYRRTKFDGVQYHSHRLIWIWHYGHIPEGFVIDHIDRDKSNNRIENLRVATHSENSHNAGLRKNNSTGFRGVTKLDNGKWMSRIRAHGVSYFLGTFESPEAANDAYQKKRAGLLSGSHQSLGLSHFG